MGLYLLVLSLVPFFAVLGGGGLSQLAVRYVASHLARGEDAEVPATVRSLWTIAMVGCLLVGFATLLLSLGLSTRVFGLVDLWKLALVLAPLVSVTVVQTLAADTYRGLSDIRSASLFGGPIASTLSLAGAVLLGVMFEHPTTVEALMVVLSATLVSASWGALAVRRRVRRLSAHPTTQAPYSAASLLRVSLPLMLSTALLLMLATMDLWVVGTKLPPADVAVYGIAVRTATLVGIPLLVVYGVLGPTIAQLHAANQHERLESALRATTALAAIPAVLLTVLFLLRGGDLLALIYGEPYRAGGHALAILSLGQSVAVMTGVCGLLMAMTGHQRLLLNISVCSLVITTAALFVVVPHQGILGAALVAASGLALHNLAMTIAAHRVTRIKTYMLWWPPHRSAWAAL